MGSSLEEHHHQQLLSFCIAWTILLGIERIYYALVYIWPETFIRFLERTNRTKLERWEYFEEFFWYIKTIQVSVISYDLFRVVDTKWELCMAFYIGLVLITIGQVLNIASFVALGRKGIFYGRELGYAMPFVHTFPYNLGINDPQYWGSLMTVYGMYIGMQASSFHMPIICTWWYGASMFLLENERGRRWVAALNARNKL